MSGTGRRRVPEPYVLPDVVRIMRENAELRRANMRLRGELAALRSRTAPIPRDRR